MPQYSKDDKHNSNGINTSNDSITYWTTALLYSVTSLKSRLPSQNPLRMKITYIWILNLESY